MRTMSACCLTVSAKEPGVDMRSYCITGELFEFPYLGLCSIVTFLEVFRIRQMVR
jgi:hypothetical protein